MASYKNLEGAKADEMLRSQYQFWMRTVCARQPAGPSYTCIPCPISGPQLAPELLPIGQASA